MLPVSLCVCVCVCSVRVVCACAHMCMYMRAPFSATLFDKKIERGGGRKGERNKRDQTKQGHDRHKTRGNGINEKIPSCLQL